MHIYTENLMEKIWSICPMCLLFSINIVCFSLEQVLHQDVLSYQRVIDSVNDKAQSLVHSSSDPQLSKFVTQAHARYQKLCIAAKVRDYSHLKVTVPDRGYYETAS
jgi:hypothetical protein